MSEQKDFEKDRNQQRVADSIENFVVFLSNPWRVVWLNFLAGISRGLGALVGASIVIAILIWILSLFKQVPLIGEYANDMEVVVQSYLYKVDYNDELGRVAETLERIEESLKNQESPAATSE